MVKRKVQSKIPFKVRKKFAGKRAPYSAPKAKTKTMSQKYPSGYIKGSVAQQVNRRHVGRTIKSVKVSPRLAKAVRQISKKEAEKELPVFTVKQVLAARCTFAPSINTQGVITIPGTPLPNHSGINLNTGDCFVLGHASELSSVIKTATAMVDADVSECKFKLLAASKKYVFTNNTTAFIELWVCEAMIRSNQTLTLDMGSDFISYCSEMNQPAVFAPIINCLGVTPHIAPQWKQKYISKVSKACIAPGGTYTVSLSIEPQDVDFENWENLGAPVLPQGSKRMFTKGLLVYGNYREVGNGAAGASFGAAATGTTNQLTVRVDSLYKFTAPSTMPEGSARNTWNFQTLGDTTSPIVALGSTFDRTAAKLAGNGN